VSLVKPWPEIRELGLEEVGGMLFPTLSLREVVSGCFIKEYREYLLVLTSTTSEVNCAEKSPHALLAIKLEEPCNEGLLVCVSA
jgi:hypothetical protein